MKIGYPCINLSIGCSPNRTFRLKNYSKENLISKIKQNLSCLEKIINYNIKHKILFFRISSDIIPFASHPVCKFNWQKYFYKDFESIGKLIKENGIRVSMHPDQFVIINSPNKEIVKRSVKELNYHLDVLELLQTSTDAKIQIHVGGVYKNKEVAIERFIENYHKLSKNLRDRLVIENDDKLFSLKDCLFINKFTGIPVVFDVFHHKCLNNGESIKQSIKLSVNTWKKSDGNLIIDYSSQDKNKRLGSHSYSLDEEDFKKFLYESKGFDFDIMFEIKSKEKAVFKAMEILKNEKFL
jgi:UV DNA damage endonuclease